MPPTISYFELNRRTLRQCILKVTKIKSQIQRKKKQPEIDWTSKTPITKKNITEINSLLNSKS